MQDTEAAHVDYMHSEVQVTCKRYVLPCSCSTCGPSKHNPAPLWVLAMLRQDGSDAKSSNGRPGGVHAVFTDWVQCHYGSPGDTTA